MTTRTRAPCFTTGANTAGPIGQPSVDVALGDDEHPSTVAPVDVDD